MSIIDRLKDFQKKHQKILIICLILFISLIIFLIFFFTLKSSDSQEQSDLQDSISTQKSSNQKKPQYQQSNQKQPAQKQPAQKQPAQKQPQYQPSKPIQNPNQQNNMKQEFINKTNEYRQKANAKPLEWDNNLENKAQEWINYLCENENCQMRHPRTIQEQNIYLNGNTWGQNLAYFKRRNVNKPLQGTVDEIIYNWGSVECNNYNEENPEIRNKGMIGHFTQLVWKDTDKLGCAKINKGDETLYACNYSPSGNIRLNGGYDLYKQNVEKPKPC